MTCAACSSAGGHVYTPFGDVETIKERDDGTEPKTFLLHVTVRNNASSTVSLVAIQGKRRRGMGSVGGKQTKEFDTRWLTARSVLVEGRIQGRVVCRTNALSGVMAGQAVQVVVNPDPRGTPARDEPSVLCTLALA